MKQHKTVNLNVKVKLSRIPSSREKDNILHAFVNVLKGSSELYELNLRDESYKDELTVNGCCLHIRKMGRP